MSLRLEDSEGDIENEGLGVSAWLGLGVDVMVHDGLWDTANDGEKVAV